MSERKRNKYLDLRQRYQPEKVRLVIGGMLTERE
jgi:hypothetical protein